MGNQTGKPWLCPECGWVIGKVVRSANKKERVGRMQQLVVFERTQIPEMVERVGRAEFGVRAIVEGSATVRCSNCDAERTWHPSQAALDLIIKRANKRGVR